MSNQNITKNERIVVNIKTMVPERSELPDPFNWNLAPEMNLWTIYQNIKRFNNVVTNEIKNRFDNLLENIEEKRLAVVQTSIPSTLRSIEDLKKSMDQSRAQTLKAISTLKQSAQSFTNSVDRFFFSWVFERTIHCSKTRKQHKLVEQQIKVLEKQNALLEQLIMQKSQQTKITKETVQSTADLIKTSSETLANNAVDTVKNVGAAAKALSEIPKIGSDELPFASISLRNTRSFESIGTPVPLRTFAKSTPISNKEAPLYLAIIGAIVCSLIFFFQKKKGTSA